MDINLHIQYLEPVKKDICVAFCFFNACGYLRPLQNLLFFENKLKAAKIPYYSIEMVIGDQPPMLANPTLRVYSKSSMFYKEALWNRLEKEIPEQYTKICFLDSDIIYQRADWLDSLSVLLDRHDIIHPFYILRYLVMTFNELKEDTLSPIITMSYIARQKITNNSIKRTAPGLGWAIRRSFFKKIGGFFDKNLLGGSDQVFCGCIMKKLDMIQSTIHPLIKELSITYFNRIYNLEYSASYFYCETLHLYHGTFKNRQYQSRENIIRNISESWNKVYTENSDRFWELNDSKINDVFHEYFINRYEDNHTDIPSTRILETFPLHIQYSRPKRRDICVAFCFFNACGYIRPIQNLLFFENKLRLAGIPYYSIELIIGNQKPVLVNPTLRFYSNSALFYKEALWNRVEKEIPEQYKKICFLDSDIIFNTADWLDNLSNLLESNDIVHPFKVASLLNEAYIPYIRFDSAILRYDKSIQAGGSGYGWAVRREFFSKIYFFDKCVLGGGDQFFYKGSVGLSAGVEWNFVGSTSLVPELGFFYGLTPLHFRAIEDNFTFSDATGTYFYQKARQNQLILKVSLLF